MDSPTAVLASSFEGHGPAVPPASSAESAGLPLEVGQVGALPGVAGSGSESGASGSSKHPNIFVRGLPLAWSEAEITAVFQQYGVLSSIRLVRHSVTKQSLGYGFVRFQDVGEANASIMALDGTSVLGHTLQVKFADADAGPPSSGAPSGLTPSDSCYVKHLPAAYGVAEAQQLFEAHGAVLDVKLFPCLDQFRGASALVRMASVEAADRAITALNNSTPPGGMQSLIVRFAESAAEKAARLSRRERQQMLSRNGLGDPGGLGLDQMQLQQAMAALGLAGLPGAPGLVRGPPPPAAMVSQPYQAAVQSSVCVKGMPSNADRLWLYENFARFGAIAGMRILIDEATGLCNGTAFINYGDPMAAQRARQAMSGMRAGDKILHVVVQQGGAGGGAGPRGPSTGNLQAAAAAMGMMPMAGLPSGGLPSGGSDQAEWQQLLQQPGVPNGMQVW